MFDLLTPALVALRHPSGPRRGASGTTGAALLLAALTCIVPADDALAAAGRFIAVVGDVRLVDENGNVARVARGRRVERGDAIITGPRGLAQLRMSDGGRLSIRADTEVKVDDYDFADDKPGAGRMFLNLLRGGLRSITGLIGQRNQKGYRISTPHATIGVRGTDHETTVLLQAHQGFAAGTFDVVYSGRTVMQVANQVVEIRPQQAGYVAAARLVPQIIQIPAFLKQQTGAAAPPTGSTGQRNVAVGEKGKPKARPGVPQSQRPRSQALKLAPSTTTRSLDPALSTTTTTLSPTRTLSPSLSTTLEPSLSTTTTKTLEPSLSTTTTRTLEPSLSTTTTTLSPTTTISPTTTLSPTTTISPTTTLSPTRTLERSTTTLSPTTTRTLDSSGLTTR